MVCTPQVQQLWADFDERRAELNGPSASASGLALTASGVAPSQAPKQLGSGLQGSALDTHEASSQGAQRLR